jgi:LytS/YehU family sensor histidine kinase
VTTYLNILKMRMGPQLEFGIDVAPELLAKSFPDDAASLVENAIKHGLEPLRGRSASTSSSHGRHRRRQAHQLQVMDTGRGFADSPAQTGGSVGLANLRERLAGLYGDNARFAIESNVPRGVVATIEFGRVPAEKTATMPAGTGTGRPPPRPRRSADGAARGRRPAGRTAYGPGSCPGCSSD